MYKLLVVDDELSIRTMLVDYLESRYDIKAAENGTEALSLLQEEQFDLVISDINLPGISGPLLLKEIRKRYPDIKTALITAYNVDDYIKIAWECSVSNIIPKTVPFNFSELESIIRSLLSGEIFGICRYLQSDAAVFKTFCITSSASAREVREEITGLFKEKFGTAGDMLLLLDEVVTNAIYHAPVLEDGTEKYTEFSEVQLESCEYIHIDCAYDFEKYGVSVVDNQGRLTKETVLKKIERQISGAGVLDDSGRGIHMSRLFSDRMIINIATNKKTEVILMNYFSKKYRGYKPLYINEL
ncbi:response regulator [Chitinispirillales bacterium ANBcel5]|uniref:response regulator n=1 Tax=Cellulosispirillum alkaliphilum TaxID=3039283 RepID=UPI002A53DD37|nr:response regulator [Chitinispirillales bacterium ANBcel5]